MGGTSAADRGEEAPLEGWARYALYAAPAPESALGRLGAEWFGTAADPAPRELRERPSFAALGRSAQGIDDLVAGPARYGFHGTLKAPFRLVETQTPAALDAALARFAAARAPVPVPRLEVAADAGFVALRPSAASPKLDARAAEIVAYFDPFRAPMTEEEHRRRNPERLAPEPRALLERWGYPWVMTQFRFHITLSRQLPPEEAADLAARLAPIFAPALETPFQLDEVALFADPGEGTFRLLRRHAFGG